MSGPDHEDRRPPADGGADTSTESPTVQAPGEPGEGGDDRRQFFKRLGRWSLVVATAAAGIESLEASATAAAAAEEGGETDGYCDMAPQEWSNAATPGDDTTWDNNAWSNTPWSNNAWDNHNDYSKWTAYSDSWVDTWGAWSNSW